MQTVKLPLNKYARISNRGHVLYFYESVDMYVANLVSYVLTAQQYGHHVLMIETEELYRLFSEAMNKKAWIASDVHYLDSRVFYRLHGAFNHARIVEHFETVLTPYLMTNTVIRTWAHVEWNETEDILRQLQEFENMADDAVNGLKLMSVCSYDANTVPASLLTNMLRSHEYYMTDSELVRSPLYKANALPET